MSAKLTILCKEENIEFAKRYARKKNTSVSAIVDELLEVLRYREKNPLSESLPEHPFVKKYAGIVKSGTRKPLENLFNGRKNKG